MFTFSAAADGCVSSRHRPIPARTASAARMAPGRRLVALARDHPVLAAAGSLVAAAVGMVGAVTALVLAVVAPVCALAGLL